MVPANQVAHDGVMRHVVWKVFAGSVWRQTVLLVSRGVLGVVMLPWGVSTFAITVPLWDWAVPDGGLTSVGSYGFTGWGRVGVLTGGVVVGGLLLLARGQVALGRSLFGADRSAVLGRRVDELPASRSAAVESAPYFAVAEALTNALKHTRATLVTVSIHDDGTALTLEVVDDGVDGAQRGPTGR
jgi:hypothetical protein